MIRWVLALLLALALAFAGERGLARAEVARRAGDPSIERLVPKGLLAGEKVAAITIEAGPGSLFYGRKQGLWRCREAYGAVCDEGRVHKLLASLVEASGVERARGEGAAAAYGLATDERIAVRLHGARVLEAQDRDVLLGFEVGRSFPEGRAFVRTAGSDRVLEIDRDPRAVLASESDAIPPLVDAQLLAGCFAGEFRGFREIRIAPVAGEAMRITRDPAAPATEEGAWILEQGGRRESFPGWRVGGYLGLWLRGRFESFASPLRPEAIGLAPAAADVVLVPEAGEPIELAVSGLVEGRRAYVLNRRTNVAGTVAPALQSLFAPRAELFTDAGRPNPWEAWLRKR